MTWMAPWVFVGLLAVAAPVLVHWLARQQAERLRFPTLRFLVRTPPVSVRRHRLRDVPLLVVRASIIVAAVAALAQPVWVRPAAPAARPARAIVVDTSASLGRALADGRVGRDVAREAAAAFAAEAGGPPAQVVPAETLAQGVAQAAAWLAREDAPRELIVVSDFQVGALVASDLDAVPADAGMRLVSVPVSGPVPAEPAPARGRLRVMAGAPGSQTARRAAAAETAARAITTSEKTSGVFFVEKDTRRLFEVVVVFEDTSAWEAARASSQPIDTPELFAWVSDIRHQLRARGTAPEETSGVFFAKKTPDVFSDFSEDGLAVFTDADPGSLEAATLMAAILRAVGPPALTPGEREPDTLAPATLQAWQREPEPGPAPGRTSGRSDGRWLWLIALALLAVESWMRRSPRVEKAEMAHADAV